MTKTATFAVMHFTVAFGVAWALTGDVVVGGDRGPGGAPGEHRGLLLP